jgi:zinc D-Ala-D-Ala carboxypeptidase
MIKRIISCFSKKGGRDLDAKIPGAENFKYREFIKSEVAIRLGIDNVPKLEREWISIEKLAVNVLQPIRNELGPIRITSGFRCKKLNKALRAGKSSNHLLGQAADIEPVRDGVTLIDVAKFIYFYLEFRNLIAEYFPSGWVHVDYREGSNLKRLKLKDSTHNYEVVTMEELLDLYANLIY